MTSEEAAGGIVVLEAGVVAAGPAAAIRAVGAAVVAEAGIAATGKIPDLRLSIDDYRFEAVGCHESAQ